MESTNYLNIAHALTFGNVQVLFVSLYKIVMGNGITKFEKIGSIFSIFGMLLISWDEPNTKSYPGAVINLNNGKIFSIL